MVLSRAITRVTPFRGLITYNSTYNLLTKSLPLQVNQRIRQSREADCSEAVLQQLGLLSLGFMDFLIQRHFYRYVASFLL